MKICYVADGTSIHTQRWVNYFAKKGHETHLICWKVMPGYEENVNIHLLTRLASKMWAVSQYFSFLFWTLQVRRLINRIKPDIVDGHFITVYGFLAACSGFRPLVVSAWGSDILVAPENSKLAELAVKFALRKADFVATTSQYLKAYLHKEFNLPQHKVRAIPWGTDLRIFQEGYQTGAKELRASLGVRDNQFVILSPRTLKNHYRIDHIVQAMPYVVAKHPSVVLILCKGPSKDSQYENQIYKQATELGVAQNIRLIDHELSHQEMAVLYNIADVLISIPKSDQFSGCIQEGMACGVIPIVGDLEVYRQYLTDAENAFFVDPEGPYDIAQKVVHCIEHPELKERFYRINRKIIEDNEDWDKNAPKREDLYLALINNPKEIQK